MIINQGIETTESLIAGAGYVAYFAPDTVSGTAANPTYTPSSNYVDMGELFAAGDVETVYDPQEDKILGRRAAGEYTAKTKSTNVELGFNFSSIQAWDPILIALNRGSTAPVASGTAGVQVVAATPKAVQGRFVMCEYGEEGTDTVIVTYHPKAKLKGAGTGTNSDQRVLKFEERAEGVAESEGRDLPTGYTPSGIDQLRGVTYLSTRGALDGLLTALGVKTAAPAP